MQIIGLRRADGCWIGRRIFHARSFFERAGGLLVRTALAREEALLLTPGGTIHTFAMRYAIDAVFLDRHLRILKIVANLAPWRVCLAPVRTRHVLEMVAGRAEVLELREGLEFFIAHQDAREAGGGERAQATFSTLPLPTSPPNEVADDQFNWKFSLRR